MMHYLLIAMLSTGGYSAQPFASKESCEAVQRAAGGTCVMQQVSTIDYSQPWNKPPILTHKQQVGEISGKAIKTNGRKVLEHSFKQDMKLHDGEDI